MALNRQQLNDLKRQVNERCAVLTTEVHADAARAREDIADTVAVAGMDRGEAAVANQIADLDQAELSRDLEELRQMQAALARFDSGTFGQCIDCLRGIDYARLYAQPAALRCLDCQRIHEHTQTHPSGPRL